MSSMVSPVQETQFALKSGLKVRTFRRDPSKFFIEMERWMENLNVGSIEKMAITGDGAGYLTLVIAYRDAEEVTKDRALLYDTVSLLRDTAEIVERLLDAQIKTPAQSEPPEGVDPPAS